MRCVTNKCGLHSQPCAGRVKHSIFLKLILKFLKNYFRNIFEKVFGENRCYVFITHFRREGKIRKIEKNKKNWENYGRNLENHKYWFPWIIIGQERIAIGVGVLHALRGHQIFRETSQITIQGEWAVFSKPSMIYVGGLARDLLYSFSLGDLFICDYATFLF